MKIAILIAGFPPRSIGGVEIATLNIALELAERGHEVHIITTGDEKLKGDKRESLHIHYIQHDIVQESSLWAAISYAIKALVQIKKINPDIVHAQRFYREGLSAWLAKVFFKKPYCTWCHGADIYLSWRFKSIASKLFLKSADAVIALTQDMERKIQEICNRDAFVIPGGIDLRRFEGLSRKNAAKSSTDSERIILFVGRLHPLKGVAYLVEAMYTIIHSNPRVRLLIVGDGEERSNLENLTNKLGLAKYISFTGKVPHEKVPEYMATADVLVLPSLVEGFGVVLLEAMACGLPIVATNVGGIPEIVQDGENGLMAESENSREIADKVLMIFENDELRKRISQNNLEKAKNYSWKAVVDKLEKVYQGIIK